MTSAVVVGSGPNGLTAAAVLAREGLDVTVIEAEPTIGGACRSDELRGTVVDRFSTGHPLAYASPALREVGLDVQWGTAPLDMAHPLFDGAGPGTLGTLADVPDCGPDVMAAFFGPLPALPTHPVAAMRWGPRFMAPASVTAAALGRVGGAVFAGVAAHGMVPQHLPMTSSLGYLLAGVRPWPVPIGGSQAIPDALARIVEGHGGTIRTGERVTRLPDADLVMLDTGVPGALDLLGERAPGWLRRRVRRWRFGPAAFKVDLVIDGGIPWLQEELRSAAFVHLGGTAREIAHKEQMVNRGRMPERPVMILSQQYLADPSRAAGSWVPVSMYVHCPNGFPGDLTESIVTEVERYAPGVRERIVEARSVGPAELEASNANLVGGDIAAGAAIPAQLIRRPTLFDPYRLTDGVYLCSAAAAPGPGVHGMVGLHAARAALRRL
ncbi:Dehydrogenase OS=Tsukamurella paurometabola (strain ATCC 8368 / DSM / CCUG 35730 / CIP 100753/ JCM 10117 / KCTC 9821 / NBRC 16120 / NCIMB 702349 / NCTC 13040) OX=521096 GN=Tpau_0805 PE=4 SV=1 [Tsukamurella paurometabola]|uniref:Dehydrogenase n=1 Tax=Tsukamurella paurometabola (strain ATCC 8368 / DSM 20162 / CCUG 35730 / CIP 100753 / JCM 10117 / KCTC 9821 / NBRC 16120 / NCIMB 702349 / NCTC 13040) TaxID=521096 RepID=D5UTT7_TSUPD|nr:NAD(P)/FAD-dependent oxidoreductase [Tsukamurella paurometabola]ADG77441.1 dehydrogenase [Tsukamurella paurometabola DSM 20162]SUP27058.1 Protoporphyrinogen oxidase [Tsukamurella paurometabola]